MKKFLYSLVVAGAFVCYAIYQSRFGAASPIALASVPSVAAPVTQVLTPGVSGEPPRGAGPSPAPTVALPTATPVQQPNPTSTPAAPTPTSIPTPTPRGQYVDGQYTGSVVNAYYGNVQVQATVTGGRLAVVNFLQYPNDRSTSRAISGAAVPQLASEAIAAQSANVDTISGATDISQAFVQSLAAALSQAKG